MSAGGGRRGLEVRDLVLIALLASIGGVLSTYVGYLGNLVNRFVGVPFGAGQIVAGLHVLWPLLARLATGRFGSGTLTGVAKGVVELLSGGTHGAVIVLVSAVEGLLVDLGMGIAPGGPLALVLLVGAVSSAANVLVFQALYFSGVPAVLLLVMLGLSLLSGAFFGGYLAWDFRRSLVAARVLRRPAGEERPRSGRRWRYLVTAPIALALLGGGVAYYAFVYDVSPGGEARVQGAVEHPFTFRSEEWADETVTVTAELRGSVTYVPPRDYVGVPLALVVERAVPKAGTSSVRVVADDGYEVTIALGSLLTDRGLLLTLEDGRLRLVAADRDGSLWVRGVRRIVVG